MQTQKIINQYLDGIVDFLVPAMSNSMMIFEQFSSTVASNHREVLLWYSNQFKRDILTELASVIGQLCNDDDTRTTISDNPV